MPMTRSCAIRRATMVDYEDLVALRLEAETWLRAAGTDQWSATERGIGDIEKHVTAGRTWVVLPDGPGPIPATITLNGPDADFWTEDDDPGSGLYVYKLIAARARKGAQLGDALLDFAGEQAEAQGKPWVRLDCWRTNTALHAYYLARHFQHLRTVEVPGRGSGALFQRPAAERTGQLVQAPTLTILEDA